MQRLVTFTILAFVVINCVVPFRHWVYGGKVEWNEHGHHFSWRMKLRGKQTALRLTAYDPESGATMLVNPQRWLTPFQVNRMARDPKMVHQFARFLRLQFAEQGYAATEIHATVMCSLNGRKPQVLIDPAVDLASLPVPGGEPTYVVPLTEPLRKDHWNVPRNQWEQFVPEKYRLR